MVLVFFMGKGGSVVVGVSLNVDIFDFVIGEGV